MRYLVVVLYTLHYPFNFCLFTSIQVYRRRIMIETVSWFCDNILQPADWKGKPTEEQNPVADVAGNNHCAMAGPLLHQEVTDCVYTMPNYTLDDI